MYAHQVIESLNVQTKSTPSAKYKELCQKMVNKIKEAQKFNTMDLSEYNHNAKSQIGTRCFCGDSCVRMPYQKIWIDYSASGSNVVDNGDIKSTKRGAYLKALQDDKHILAMFFTYVDTISTWLISPISLLIRQSPEIRNDDISGSPNVIYYNNYLPPDIANQKGKLIVKEFQDDIGIINFTLLFLNTKNIDTIDHEPPPKLNKSRKKKGKCPIFTYKTLVIKPTSKKQQEQEAQGLWNNRIHLCRGHFKEYTPEKPLFGKFTGRYWWQPSVRGRNTDGVVMKDYEVRT